MDGSPGFDGCSDVDATRRDGGDLAGLRRIGAVRRWTARGIERREVRPGMVPLDAGCRTGQDVRDPARRVAPGGRAIGFDASCAMVAGARRRPHGDGCAPHRGDPLRLRLPDASVDGLRAKRALPHLPSAGRAVRERARAVRPGGRLMTAEPDRGTLAPDAAALGRWREDAAIVAAGGAVAATIALMAWGRRPVGRR